MKRVCMYHGVDLDGFCSGAIYVDYMSRMGMQYELIPINYGWKVPWERLEDAEVTMVDFSLLADDFCRLKKIAKSVIWIDHHRTAAEEYLKCLDNKAEGISSLGECKFSSDEEGCVVRFDEGKSGCELTWEYFFKGKTMPVAVELLGRYDVWDHRDERVLPFQYGMRSYDLDPSKGIDFGMWKILFADGHSGLFHNILREGQIILQYEKKQAEGTVRASCFVLHWEFFRWLVVNGGRGSKQFDSVWDNRKYSGMITFAWNGKEWTCGLYTDAVCVEKGIDCGAIAKRYGGGGHTKAAGFRCKELPFDLSRGEKLRPSND